MWLMWLMMKNTLGDELMYNSNSVRNNENVIIVGNKGVFINGKEYPLPDGKSTNSTIIDNHVFVNGYELKKRKMEENTEGNLPQVFLMFGSR